MTPARIAFAERDGGRAVEAVEAPFDGATAAHSLGLLAGRS